MLTTSAASAQLLLSCCWSSPRSRTESSDAHCPVDYVSPLYLLVSQTAILGGFNSQKKMILLDRGGRWSIFLDLDKHKFYMDLHTVSSDFLDNNNTQLMIMSRVVLS